MAPTELPLARYPLVRHVRLIILALIAFAAAAQTSTDPARLREAGVCSRCHVAQVLEWSTSRHTAAGVACQNCHGSSKGHVANERNEVKPDRLPHGRGYRRIVSIVSCARVPKD